MRKNRQWLVYVLAAIVSGTCFVPNAYARKEYNTQFWELYPSMKEHKEVQCGVCHGKEKKVRNDYGMAFGGALGKPKVTDAAQIKAALEQAESAKSATEDKTFGDLIKDGKLPGKAP